MAGARERITIEVDDAELRQQLSRLTGSLQDLSPVMREIGEILMTSTKRRFETETDPDGNRWEENSDVTLMRYLSRAAGALSKRRTSTGGQTLNAPGMARLASKKILADSGDLGSTIRYQLEDNGQSVVVGTDRKYGAMQQFGGTKSQWPHLWGDIPARPFLGISEDDRSAIFDVLADYLSRSA